MQSNLRRDYKMLVNLRSDFKCPDVKILAFILNQTESEH